MNVAKEHLILLWQRIEQREVVSHVAYAPDVQKMDLEEDILGYVDDDDVIFNEALHNKPEFFKNISDQMLKRTIAEMIDNFMEIKANRQLSAIEFWKRNKYNYPELYKLFEIVLAVPATQVSVERLFSAL